MGRPAYLYEANRVPMPAIVAASSREPQRSAQFRPKSHLNSVEAAALAAGVDVGVGRRAQRKRGPNAALQRQPARERQLCANAWYSEHHQLAATFLHP